MITGIPYAMKNDAKVRGGQELGRCGGERGEVVITGIPYAMKNDAGGGGGKRGGGGRVAGVPYAFGEAGP